ncbi:MAG: nitroreductase family protein, partial [Oscillospiraceae bacterium]
DDKERLLKMPSILQGRGINKFTDNVQAFIVICETKAKLMAGATCDSQHYAQMDIGLSTAHIVLSATELGLSTCIMGSFQEEPIKEFLSIPTEAKIRLVVAVGYAKEEKIREKSRKEFDEICSFNQW